MRKRVKHGIIVLFLHLALVGGVPAETASFADAVEAYNAGDYGSAFRLTYPIAEEGDADAQLLLSSLYAAGRGAPQDDAQAANWLRKAAEQGRADAQVKLAALYGTGRGVERDDAEAVRWYWKAAEQGRSDAQRMLGLFYATGKGVPRDFVEAYMWLDIGAANGDQNAPLERRELGEVMTEGEIKEGKRLSSIWLKNHQAKPR